MTYILSIETATKVCSVALHQNGDLCASRELAIDRSHSGSLVPMISDMMEGLDIKMGELAAVAVSKGPGSYTGLRIGVSTAKGLCYALGVPLISVDTLMAMANGIKVKTDLLCPMLDARRMEVYCSIFDRQINCIEPTNSKVIDVNSFHDFLEQKSITFFGSGSDKCKLYLDHANVYFIDDFEASAVYMGSAAYDYFTKKAFEDLAYFEPFYLKEFQGKKPKANQIG